MSVRINVTIPAGDLEVIIPMHLTIADSGTKRILTGTDCQHEDPQGSSSI